MPNVEVKDALLDEKDVSAENAVASSKSNTSTSELVFGDEVLEVVKVVGLQMIVIGLR